MTHDELEAIEARCNTATPGPWKFEHTPYSDDPIRVGNSEYIICHSVLSKRDANFIAQARQDVSALIAEVKRLKRERDAAVCDMDNVVVEAVDNSRGVKSGCIVCKHSHYLNCTACLNGGSDCFEWRGVQEADNA